MARGQQRGFARTDRVAEQIRRDLAELIRHRCEVAGWLPDSLPVSLVARWIVSRAVVSLDSPWGPLFPLQSAAAGEGQGCKAVGSSAEL